MVIYAFSTLITLQLRVNNNSCHAFDKGCEWLPGNIQFPKRSSNDIYFFLDENEALPFFQWQNMVGRESFYLESISLLGNREMKTRKSQASCSLREICKKNQKKTKVKSAEMNVPFGHIF